MKSSAFLLIYTWLISVYRRDLWHSNISTIYFSLATWIDKSDNTGFRFHSTCMCSSRSLPGYDLSNSDLGWSATSAIKSTGTDWRRCSWFCEHWLLVESIFSKTEGSDSSRLRENSLNHSSRITSTTVQHIQVKWNCSWTSVDIRLRYHYRHIEELFILCCSQCRNGVLLRVDVHCFFSAHHL